MFSSTSRLGSRNISKKLNYNKFLYSKQADPIPHSRVPLNSVFKVASTSTSPNYFLPWQKKASRDGSGSGFVLKTEYGNSLITNAHVVADSTYVSVRKALSPISYRARVIAISHEADLALLDVEDKVFWEGSQEEGDHPVEGLILGDLPQLQDHVNVIGFPTGGEGVSITRGVVSRIEPIQYAHASVHLLGIQIDAAINSGNSGGPALLEGTNNNSSQKNEVAGIAFQCLLGADNIGYIIPGPVITHFLTQYQLHKNYTGFPQMGIGWQTLENDSMKSFFKIPQGLTGVVINKIIPVSPASKVVRAGDILHSIDGCIIANNGTVHFRNGERVYLNYLFVKKFVGEFCKCEIIREGKKLEVSFSLLSSTDLALIPTNSPSNKPSYLVIGGLVFTRLTIAYLREYSGEDENNWYDTAPRSLVHRAFHSVRESIDQELVVLSHVLADDINFGYAQLSSTELLSFNGKKVMNMRHLHQMINDNEEQYLRFDFTDNIFVVLEKKDLAAASKRIMVEYALPSNYSDDLELNEKKSKKKVIQKK